MNFRIQRCYHA